MAKLLTTESPRAGYSGRADFLVVSAERPNGDKLTSAYRLRVALPTPPEDRGVAHRSCLWS